MSHAFNSPSAKPAFGTLKQVASHIDYLQKLKAKKAYCKSSNKCNNINNSAQSYNDLYLKNELFRLNKLNNCTLLPFNKTNLIVNLYSKMDLTHACTLIDGFPCLTNSGCYEVGASPQCCINICKNDKTIDVSSTAQQFNLTNTIDPIGSLFGNTKCGILNFTHFMVFNPLTDPNNPSLNASPYIIYNSDEIIVDEIIVDEINNDEINIDSNIYTLATSAKPMATSAKPAAVTLATINKTLTNAITKINSSTSQALATINNKVTIVTKNLNLSATQAITTINTNVSTSTSTLNSITNQSINNINTNLTKATSTIGTATTQATSAINSNLQSATNTIDSVVNNATTQATSKIDSLVNDATTQATSKIDSLVNDATSTIGSVVNNATTQATNTIDSVVNNATTQAITTINTNVTQASSTIGSVVNNATSTIGSVVNDATIQATFTIGLVVNDATNQARNTIDSNLQSATNALDYAANQSIDNINYNADNATTNITNISNDSTLAINEKILQALSGIDATKGEVITTMTSLMNSNLLDASNNIEAITAGAIDEINMAAYNANYGNGNGNINNEQLIQVSNNLSSKINYLFETFFHADSATIIDNYPLPN